MSMETFKKISSYFCLAKWVHLQGWGEPLENENLIEMVHLAKQSNCLASFTTNGVNLTEEISMKLLAEGLDLIVVSIGGDNKLGHEILRAGSDFSQIIDNVKRLTALKKQLNCTRPRVKLSQIMTKFNIRGIPQLIPLAAELGADEVMATNLDYLVGERCNLLRTFYHESPTKEFQDSIDEMHRRGKEMGIAVLSYPLRMEQVPICEADPPQNVFFSVDGSVAPCVYLRIPKKGDISRIFRNKEYHVPQVIFGNINDEDFFEIWDKESYKDFRKRFSVRKKIKFGLLAEAFINLNPSSVGKESRRKLPPLPEVCQTCYKAYGI